MPLGLELLQYMWVKPSMQSRSPINLRSDHWNNPHSARIAHASTWTWQLPCLRVCLQRLLKKRALAGQVLLLQEQPIHCSNEQPNKSTHVDVERKGKKADLVGVHTEEPLCDEIFLDDVCAPNTNEAYTTIHLPSSAGNKGMASLWVRVNTGASRSVLPMHLFNHLYPDHINKAGQPTGLNVSNAKLTAYSGTQIPLFGSLHGPII